MNLDRLSKGEMIAGVSAALLFVFMFFDWFGVKVNTGNLLPLIVASGGGNAWQTLEEIPIFLVLTIAVVVGSALMRLAGLDWKPAIPANAAVTMFGGLASLLILIRIVSPPGSMQLSMGFSIEPTLKVGVVLALAASLGIVFGGCLAMWEERDSFADLRARPHRG